MSSGKGHEESSAAKRQELLEELRLHLQWASRYSADSPSRKVLRRMFERPDVLDMLEEVLRDA